MCKQRCSLTVAGGADSRTRRECRAAGATRRRLRLYWRQTRSNGHQARPRALKHCISSLMPTGRILLVALALGATACADSGPIIHGTFARLFGGGDEAGEDTAVEGVPASARKRVRADLAGRLEVSADRLLTLSAEPAAWPDTSFGCERLAGEHVIEGPVKGYRIVLGYAGQRYDYRVQEDGPFVLCEQIAVR
jgi:hypothetical protein